MEERFHLFYYNFALKIVRVNLGKDVPNPGCLSQILDSSPDPGSNNNKKEEG